MFGPEDGSVPKALLGHCHRFVVIPTWSVEGTMSEQKFPPGWDEARVREVLEHYENQIEDEQFAEIEAAREAEGVTMIAVPDELADEVRALIARKQSAQAG